MSGYTPGPWTIENPEQSIGSIDSVPTGNRVGQAFEVSVKDRNSGNPQRVANARLMAAAPDLLEALRDLMPEFESRIGDFENAEWHDCWNKAVAAIAKATGEQS